MNITQNWFYKIKNLENNQINIAENIYVSLFLENIENDIIINIMQNSKADIYGFFSEKSPENIILNQKNNSSIINFKSIFIWNSKDLSSNISSKINSNNSSSNLSIISIVKENKISINSDITISKDSKGIDAKLELENIFIWNNGTIISNPNLFIDSKDVKVSHSSKTHRIPEEKLFYLKSRWINHNESTKIMLESYFKKTFSCIEVYNKELFKNIYDTFLKLN